MPHFYLSTALLLPSVNLRDCQDKRVHHKGNMSRSYAKQDSIVQKKEER